MRGVLPERLRGSQSAQTDDRAAGAISDSGRQGLALFWGITVWAGVFAAAFSLFWYVCFHVVEDALFAYVGLWILPQLLSSVGGAMTLVAVRRTLAYARPLARRFAAATCAISAPVGVLSVLLVLRDMSEGLGFLGWFAAILGAVFVVDTLLAVILAGVFAIRVARRYASPQG